MSDDQTPQTAPLRSRSFIGRDELSETDTPAYAQHRFSRPRRVSVFTSTGEVHHFEAWRFTPSGDGEPYDGHHRYGVDASGALHIVHVDPHGPQVVATYAPHAWQRVNGGDRPPVTIEAEPVEVHS